MKLKLKIETWDREKPLPTTREVSFGGDEFRVYFASEGEDIGHVILFRGNETLDKKSKVIFDFVPGATDDEEIITVAANNI